MNDTDALKPVARPFNLPNHFHHNMTISGLSLHYGNTDSCKNVSTGYTLATRNQLTPLIPLIYLQIYVIIFAPMVKLLLTLLKTNSTHNSSIRSDEGLTLEMSALQMFHGGNSTVINSFDKTKFLFHSHRRSATVSLETRNLLTTFAI